MCFLPDDDKKLQCSRQEGKKGAEHKMTHLQDRAAKFEGQDRICKYALQFDRTHRQSNDDDDDDNTTLCKNVGQPELDFAKNKIIQN